MNTKGPTENLKSISTNPEEVEKYMEDRIGLGESFDLGVRKIKVLNKEVQLCKWVMRYRIYHLYIKRACRLE